MIHDNNNNKVNILQERNEIADNSSSRVKKEKSEKFRLNIEKTLLLTFEKNLR
jgi:hypothetical protein